MFNVLQRFLNYENAPGHKVLEIKSESLGALQVLVRDDAMILFGPPLNAEEESKPFYEIVFQRPTTDSNSTSFSLYRTMSQQEAEDIFNAFWHRLPTFISIAKEFFSVNGLQRVCDVLRENPSWSLTHIMAFFNLSEYIKNPKVLQFVDYSDHIYLMSPLQLAIKSGNIEMVKALLPLAKLDHLDNEDNSLYHYAAKTSKDIINLLKDKSLINLNHVNKEGYTPLHLACLENKVECVHALILAGADVNLEATSVNRKTKTATPVSVASVVKGKDLKVLYSQDMKSGGTPLHWCSSREISQALIKEGCDVNALNFEGKTALHVMINRNRFDCFVTLLANEADPEIPDAKGNTALSLAIQKRLIPFIQSLIVFGCDINAAMREGHTARHLVGSNNQDPVEDSILFILHSVGAQRCSKDHVNCPDGCSPQGNFNGKPPEAPENLEIRNYFETMLAPPSDQSGSQKTEIAMETRLIDSPEPGLVVDTEKEQKGQTIMDSLLGTFSNEAGSCKKQKLVHLSPENEETSKPHLFHKEQGYGRLLCLDGGGIRGLCLAQMLLEIEELSQTPIIELFDWIAGTSTGGILALALGCGKTMRQCLALYMQIKEYCFVGSRPYSSERFEKLLKEHLGEFTVMTDIKKPKIMVAAVMADRKPIDLHFFRNYKSASDILGLVTPINNRRSPPQSPENQLVWHAARATGAAPSYFRSFGCFLDGGLVANNPTLDALTEIYEYNMALSNIGYEAVPLSVAVSLGTGLLPVIELKNIDVFRPERIMDTVKIAYGISTIGHLLIEQATASEGRVVDRARAWCSSIKTPYYRFNPPLSKSILIDEKDDEKLMNMLWCSKVYIHNNRQKVIEMINLLKQPKSKL